MSEKMFGNLDTRSEEELDAMEHQLERKYEALLKENASNQQEELPKKTA